MSHSMTTIQEFVKDINNGRYVIPHFQRDYDWSPGMVSELFISIINKYYSGTILLWVLKDSDRELKMWDPLWSAPKAEKPEWAVLDGQQRLTSIYYALKQPKEHFPNRSSYYSFYVDLDALLSNDEESTISHRYTYTHIDKNYLLKHKDYYIKEGLFPITLLGDPQFIVSDEYELWIKKYLESRYEEGRWEEVGIMKVNRILSGILQFEFLTESLRDKELKEICSVFANINSKGLRLSVFDLMNAFLYPHGIPLRKRWEGLDNPELKEIDSDMKTQVLKLMSLYKQRYCSSSYLFNLIPGSKVKDRQRKEQVLVEGASEFEKLWIKSVKYAELARKKVMSNGTKDFGAIKSLFIPNVTLIPVLGALMWRYEEDFKNILSEEEFGLKIRKWYWSAAISQDYSGSSDSVMSKDYREILFWFEDDENVPERVAKVNHTFIDEQLDLKNVKNTNNSQYSTILNLIALRKSQDLYTGRVLGNFSTDEIHDHHIFPKKSGIEVNNSVDSILNRTLLVDSTNLKIRNKKPSDYIKEIEKKFKNKKDFEEMLASHFISLKAFKHLVANEFDNFIDQRNKTIKAALKEKLGLKESDRVDQIEPGRDFDNQQLYISYIKDSSDHIFLIDPYFNLNALRLIRQGIDGNDSLTKVKILSFPNHVIDEDFISAYKRLVKQFKKDDIEFTLKVVHENKHKKQIHDRYLINADKSYNFVSADTASIGQLSHIKEVDDMEPFFWGFWKVAENLLDYYSKIQEN